MKQEKNDQIRAYDNGMTTGPEKSKAPFFRNVLFIVLLGIILIIGLWARSKIQATQADRQLSQLVSEAVGQTLTHVAANPVFLQTPPVEQNSSLDGAVLSSITPPARQPTPSEGPSAPASIPSLATDTAELCSPIDGVEIQELKTIISQPFNVPNQLSDLGHHGVDFGSYNFHGQYLYEVPVQAILSGQVAGITVNRPPIGNVVILETKYDDLPLFLREYLEVEPDESLYHFYGHLLDEPTVEIGTWFNCGAQINLLGKSQTVEAHLHLETRVGKSGLIISQMAFYDTATTDEERAEYLWWRTSGELIAVDPMSIFQIFLEQEENPAPDH